MKENFFNEYDQPLGNAVTDWQPRETPDRLQSLKGRFCLLEPLDIKKHSEILHEAFWLENSSASWTYLPYGPFETLEALQAWMKKIIAEQDTLLYAIVDVKTQRPIGLCGYLRINPDHGVIEVGHLHFSSLLKKTPLATEAMYLMMHYALEKLKYRRYEWKCNSLNEASKKAALRLGFQFEGIFRQSNVFKGYNRDTAWFSIIDKEWLQLKLRFERWLHADNFDSHDKQIKRLEEL
jgi:RimJ/RimL family protein N-acetyltransferase